MAPVFGMDVVLIQFSFANTRDETFPNAGAIPSGHKRVAIPVPVVEIPDQRNRLRIGGPNGKIGAGLPVHFNGVAA